MQPIPSSETRELSSNASHSSKRTDPTPPGGTARPANVPDEATREMALKIAERLDQKQASDIRILDVSGPLVIADYFVVATVQSTRQAQSLAKELDIEHKALRGRRKRNGGADNENSSWVLLDFDDIVVHLFLPDARDYYGLESLWADVPRLEFTPSAPREASEPSSSGELRQPTLDGFDLEGFGALQPADEPTVEPTEGDASEDGDADEGSERRPDGA